MNLRYLEKNINTNVKFSFHKKEDFFQTWHYHSELEIVYIIKGKGTLYAGDFIGPYQENDIILLGENLPHMFDARTNKSGENKAFVFHIHKNFLKKAFHEFSEFHYLKDIMELSTRGALFRHKKNITNLDFLNNLKEANDAQAVLQLFQFLFRLSNYNSPKHLCKMKWENIGDANEKRIREVINFILDHFNESLDLEKAARIAGMNKAAFCRQFKKSTGKSFVEFLNETRVNYARKLLLDASADYRISEICYQAGFNSLSYFNRTFKKYTGYGPSAYKRQKHQIAVK